MTAAIELAGNTINAERRFGAQADLGYVVVSRLEKRGYHFVRVDELLDPPLAKKKKDKPSSPDF